MELVMCVIGIHKWKWSLNQGKERVIQCEHCGKIGHDLSAMKDYVSREETDTPAHRQGERK